MQWAVIPAILSLLVVTSGCVAPRPDTNGSGSPPPLDRSQPDVEDGLPVSELADVTPAVQFAPPANDPLHSPADPPAPLQDGLPTSETISNAAAASEQLPTDVVPQVDGGQLLLDEVHRSVYESYPLLQVALQQRRITAGQWLAAQGEFDTKLKGGGTTGPLGFYETHRFGAGVEQALFGGGEVFAGYRIGRGNFQPWYGERQTNDGGEWKAGFLIPLQQDRAIDPRRAAIFRAALGREAVEPDVLLQLIDFVRAASYAYFAWVAAGQEAEIAQSVLEIAQLRQDAFQKRVDRGDLPRIDLTDNQRLIVTRRATLIDAQRKFEQAAIKLSMFLRTTTGETVIVPSSRLPTDFPDVQPYEDAKLDVDLASALALRPELQSLVFVRRQLQVDLAQARNLYKPEVDLGLIGSQDVGAPSSSKRDKSPFELEASLSVAVPVQRRKAIGRIRSIQGKLAQVTAKEQFTGDKITTEVRNAVAAIRAAYARIEQAQQSVKLNIEMEQAERRRFDQGDSNLLLVNLRETATADARKTLVAALLEYFLADADYRAAMATVPTTGI